LGFEFSTATLLCFNEKFLNSVELVLNLHVEIACAVAGQRPLLLAQEL